MNLNLGWLSSITVPSVVIKENPESSFLYSSSCSLLDSTCYGSLTVLCDQRQGSKRAIDYLTPNLRLSKPFPLRFRAPNEPILALETALWDTVSKNPPQSNTNAFPYSWFTAFRETIFRLTHTLPDFSSRSGSTLHMPLAFLYAVSASEENILDKFRAMDTESATVSKVFVLVKIHSGENVHELVTECNKQLGNRCMVLDLESDYTLEETFHLIVERIVKLTSNRLFHLHQTVSQQRKVLTNVFRGFFSTTAAPAPSEESSVPLVQNLRSIAELMFVLGDYTGAQAHYVLVKDELSASNTTMGGTSNNTAREDHVQIGYLWEMICLCGFLQQQQQGGGGSMFPRASEYMDKAIDAYLLSVPMEARVDKKFNMQRFVASRLITRAGLLSASIGGNIRVLRRSLSQESELCSALTLEYIAGLLWPSGMSRKACFDLLKASSLYRSQNLPAHAMRCLLQINSKMRGNNAWYAAKLHLYVNLANLAQEVGDLPRIVEFRGLALETGLFVSSGQSQQEWLTSLCNASGDSNNTLKYALPRVNRVVFPNQPLFFALEPYEIDVYLDNPLVQCQMEISNLHLFTDYQENVVVSRHDITLAPGQKNVCVRLQVTPQREGNLQLVGLRWTLSQSRNSRFQHVWEPLVMAVKPCAPCLHLVACEANHKTEEDSFRILIKNTSETMSAKGPFVLVTKHAGSVILLPETQTSRMDFSVLDVLPTEGGKRLQLPPIEIPCLEQQWFYGQHFAHNNHQEEDVAILEYDLKRQVTLPLPRLTRHRAVSVTSARVVCTALGEVLLHLELSSPHNAFRPVHVTSVSSSSSTTSPWHVAHKVSTRTSTVELFANQWSVVVQLKRDDSSVKSQLLLDESRSMSAFPALQENDIRLRSFIASKLLHDQLMARRKREQERALLEAKGELPVTIQDVRRAAAAAAAQSSTEDKQQEEHIHVAVDCEFDDQQQQGDRCYATRIPVHVPEIHVSVLPHVHRLVLLPHQMYGQIPVDIAVENTSEITALKHVRVLVGGSQQHPSDVSRVNPPCPLAWLGTTRCVIPVLLPKETFRIQIVALFSSTGVYSVGPIQVECGSVLVNHLLSHVQFVSVFRSAAGGGKEELENAYYEDKKALRQAIDDSILIQEEFEEEKPPNDADVFRLVQQELNDDTF